MESKIKEQLPEMFAVSLSGLIRQLLEEKGVKNIDPCKISLKVKTQAGVEATFSACDKRGRIEVDQGLEGNLVSISYRNVLLKDVKDRPLILLIDRRDIFLFRNLGILIVEDSDFQNGGNNDQIWILVTNPTPELREWYYNPERVDWQGKKT